MSALAPYVGASFCFSLCAGLTVFYFVTGSDGSKNAAEIQPAKNSAGRWESGYGTLTPEPQDRAAVTSRARIEVRKEESKPVPKLFLDRASEPVMEAKRSEGPGEPREELPPEALDPTHPAASRPDQRAFSNQGSVENPKEEPVQARQLSQQADKISASLEKKPGAGITPTDTPAAFPAQGRGAPTAPKNMPDADPATLPAASLLVAQPQPSAALQPPSTVQSPSAQPAKPKSSVSPQQEAEMLSQSREALKLGDVAGARLLLQYLADHGSGAGAFGLAQTYDPPYLAALGVPGLKGDAKMARSWYGKARALGNEEAAAKLAKRTE